MQSKNFEFLRPRWEELADLGALAEQYTHPDPPSAVAKLRTFAEQIVLFIYHQHGLPKPYQCNLNDLLTAPASSRPSPGSSSRNCIPSASTAIRGRTVSPSCRRPPSGCSRKPTSWAAGCT